MSWDPVRFFVKLFSARTALQSPWTNWIWTTATKVHVHHSLNRRKACLHLGLQNLTKSIPQGLLLHCAEYQCCQSCVQPRTHCDQELTLGSFVGFPAGSTATTIFAVYRIWHAWRIFILCKSLITILRPWNRLLVCASVRQSGEFNLKQGWVGFKASSQIWTTCHMDCQHNGGLIQVGSGLLGSVFVVVPCFVACANSVAGAGIAGIAQKRWQSPILRHSDVRDDFALHRLHQFHEFFEFEALFVFTTKWTLDWIERVIAQILIKDVRKLASKMFLSRVVDDLDGILSNDVKCVVPFCVDLLFGFASVLDLSNNRLDGDGEQLLEILQALPQLSVLYLQGNPIVNKIRSYRKTLISRLHKLTYVEHNY